MTEREKPKRVAGQVVYVGLRVYDPATKKMRNCKGLNIRLEKFTPTEVHDLIVQAVLKGVPTARIVGGGRNRGEATTSSSGSGGDVASSTDRREAGEGGSEAEPGSDRPLLRP